MKDPMYRGVRRQAMRPISTPPIACASKLLKHTLTLSGLLALMVFAGCASTEEISSYRMVQGNKTPRPSHILIYDFAATSADIQGDAPVGARISAAASLPAEQIAKDRKLGSSMAAQLATAIREMGLPAERALPGATSQVSDLVIRGYLVSIHESGDGRRLTLGFYFNAAELRTVVESFQVTEQGLASQWNFDTP